MSQTLPYRPMDALKVYAVHLDDAWNERAFQCLLKMAAPATIARLKTFANQADAYLTAFSELLARYAAVKNTGIKNAGIVIAHGEHGKPYISNASGFHYNTAHSGEWVVCAAHDRPVGIDIEQVKYIDLADYRHYLSPEEYYNLTALPPGQRSAAFYELWTLKESYLKQTGLGLSLPPSSFTLRTHGNDYVLIQPSGVPAGDIYFRSFDNGDEYKTAVCTTTGSSAGFNIVTLEMLVTFFAV